MTSLQKSYDHLILIGRHFMLFCNAKFIWMSLNIPRAPDLFTATIQTWIFQDNCVFDSVLAELSFLYHVQLHQYKLFCYEASVSVISCLIPV